MTSSEVLLTKFVWRFFDCCSENDHFSIKYNYTKSWQTYIEVGIGSTRSLEETNVREFESQHRLLDENILL